MAEICPASHPFGKNLCYKIPPISDVGSRLAGLSPEAYRLHFQSHGEGLIVTDRMIIVRQMLVSNTKLFTWLEGGKASKKAVPMM